MTKEEVRMEINYRLEREARYVLAFASGDKDIYLIKRIEDNDKSLQLLGKYLETEFGDTWEKFYRENYWEKK